MQFKLLPDICCMMRSSLFLFLVFLITEGTAQTFRLATYRYDTNNRIVNLEPLANHIEKTLGIQVEIHSYQSVPEFITALQMGEVDLGFINTFGYLLLSASEKKHPMWAPVTWVVPKDTKDVYKTSFLARNNSTINWSKLKEKSAEIRVALVAPGSTSGNLVPRLLLNSRMISSPEKEFKSLQYAGTHKEAVETIINGSADLAAMGQDAFLVYQQENPGYKNELREIAVSPEIPLGPALVNTRLPVALQEKLVACLLIVHQDNPQVIEQLRAGWTEARKATHFEKIKPNHYQQLLEAFGPSEAVSGILLQFAQ